MKKLLLSICVLTGLMMGSSQAYAQENFFTIDVYFNSADEDVNAFGSTLTLPASWDIDELSLKDSNLIYWVEAPQKSDTDSMLFSGVFPGGVRNLANYSTPLLLFSLKIHGDLSLIEQITFTDDEIYLNHPMSLKAEDSGFSYKIRSENDAQFLGEVAALDDLLFSFSPDPVTGSDSLVINSYRGALAAYTFEVKEGDFWTDDWLKINGVSALNAETSTVSLFATAPNGDQETLILRTSKVRTSLIIIGIGLSICFIVYLFGLSLKVLRFDPLTLRPTLASHSMARSRDTTKEK